MGDTNEIAALRAENARLREALGTAVLWARDDKCAYPADAEKFEQRIEILRAALTPSALSGGEGE